MIDVYFTYSMWCQNHAKHLILKSFWGIFKYNVHPHRLSTYYSFTCFYCFWTFARFSFPWPCHPHWITYAHRCTTFSYSRNLFYAPFLFAMKIQFVGILNNKDPYKQFKSNFITFTVLLTPSKPFSLILFILFVFFFYSFSFFGVVLFCFYCIFLFGWMCVWKTKNNPTVILLCTVCVKWIEWFSFFYGIQFYLGMLSIYLITFYFIIINFIGSSTPYETNTVDG